MRLRRSDQDIYTALSDFRNLSPALEGKVEEWQAEQTSCSFKVKGFTVNLNMLDCIPYNTIKIGGERPVEFTFWIQLKNVEPYDTRMRLVLHAELNMMMRYGWQQVAEESRRGCRSFRSG